MKNLKEKLIAENKMNAKQIAKEILDGAMKEEDRGLFITNILDELYNMSEDTPSEYSDTLAMEFLVTINDWCEQHNSELEDD